MTDTIPTEAAAASRRRDPALRFAMRLHARLAAGRAGDASARLDGPVRHLLDAQRSLERAWRLASAARSNGWSLAARRLAEGLPAAVRRVRDAATTVLDGIADPARPALGPDPRELLAELAALRAEFGGVHLDLRRNVVGVATEPIDLGDVALGPFRVEFHAGARAGGRAGDLAVRCVALEPNPASGCPSTTHPHVRDDVPCLGEATAGVAAALRDGRLSDAALAVAAVLRTYNGGSPFVPLEDWDGGRPCDDCGRRCGQDDSARCQSCDGEFCDGCTGACDGCGETSCHNCLDRDVFRQDLCPACRGHCDGCDAVLPTATLAEHGGRCPDCADEAQAEADGEEHPPRPATADAPGPSADPMTTVPVTTGP